MNQIALKTRRDSENSGLQMWAVYIYRQNREIKYRNSLIGYSWGLPYSGHGLISWQPVID